MTFSFKTKHRKVVSSLMAFLMLMQSFASSFLFLLPSQTYASNTTIDLDEVNLSLNDSNEFELVVQSDDDVEYSLTYEDKVTSVPKGIQGKANAKDGLATANLQDAGVCSTNSCTEDVVVDGELTLPNNDFKSDFIVSEDGLWLIKDNTAKITKIKTGVSYSFPLNKEVSITFTELPEVVGTLTIEEVTLTDEQVEQLGALSNKAYDVTSNMENGTFKYDLTLPLPEGADADTQVVYAEDIDDLANAKEVEEVVEGNKAVVNGLDHFTIWIAGVHLTPDISISINDGQHVTVSPHENIDVEVSVGGDHLTKWSSTAYKIGGGSWQCVNTDNHQFSHFTTYTSTHIDVQAPVSEGTYDLKIAVYKRSNYCRRRRKEDIEVFSNAITVDNTKPSATITYPQSNSVFNSGFVANGTANDPAGIQDVRVRFRPMSNLSDLAATFWANYDDVNHTWSVSIPEGSLPDDNYKVIVRVRDKTLQNTKWLSRTNVLIDTTDPDVPVQTGYNVDDEGDSNGYSSPRPVNELNCSGGETNINAVSIHWTDVSSSGSHVKYQRQFKVGNGSWTGNEVYSNPYTNYRSFGSSVGNDDIYGSRVKAWEDYNDNGVIDSNENVSDWSNECSITYDHTAPTSNLSFSANLNEGSPVDNNEGWRDFGYYKSFNEINLDIQSGDADDFLNYQVLNGDVNCPAVANGYSSVTNHTNIANDFNGQDGIYTLCYYAEDLAGNVEVGVNKEIVKVDATRGVTAIVSVSGHEDNGVRYQNTDHVAISFTSVDDESGIARVRAYLYDNLNCSGDAIDTSYVDDTVRSASEVGNYNFDSGHLDDGEYCYHIWGYDKSQNWTNFTNVPFVIDTVAPERPSLITPVNNSVVQGDVLLSDWSTIGDADHYIYESYHDDGATNLRWHHEYPQSEKTAYNVIDATFWWRVKAVDLAGNESSWSDLWKVTIDNTAPVTTIDSIKYDDGTIEAGKFKTNDNTPLILGTVNDDNGVNSVKLTVDGHEYDANLDGSNWSVDIATPLADGSYVMSVRAVDMAGNETIVTQEIVIDTVVPTAEFRQYDGNDEITGIIAYVDSLSRLSFTGTYTDADPSVGLYKDSYVIFEAQDDGSFRFSQDGKRAFCSWRQDPTFVDISSGSVSRQAFTNCTNSLDDGEYYMAHQVYDTATRKDIPSINQFRDVLGLHFIVDHTVPTITDLDVTPLIVKAGDTVTVRAKVTDNSGIQAVSADFSYNEAYSDRPTVTSVTMNAVGDDYYEVVYTVPADWREGDVYVKVAARDNTGGNWTRSDEYKVVVVDNTIPVITFDTPINDSMVRGDIDLQATCDEDCDYINFWWRADGESYSNVSPDRRYHYEYDDGQVFNWTLNTLDAQRWGDDPSYVMEDGVYYLYAAGKDLVGNWSRTSGEVKVTVDNTAPTVDLVMNPADPDGRRSWYVAEPTITLTANDNYEVDHIEYQWNSSTGTWLNYSTPLTPPSEGRNTLYYRSFDKVGNESEIGIKEVKYDNTAPTDGAGNLRVENVRSTTADAKWDKPANSDDIARFVLTWVHEDGQSRSTTVDGNTFEAQLYDLFDGEWEVTLDSQDEAGHSYKVRKKFTVGSTREPVLGVSTENNTPSHLYRGVVAGVSDENNDKQVEDEKTVKETNEDGSILGESTSCSSWKFYLPIVLMSLQAVLLMIAEFVDKNTKKFLTALVIAALIITAFYLLKDVSCYVDNQGIMNFLSKWFVAFSLGLFALLRFLFSITFG